MSETTLTATEQKGQGLRKIRVSQLGWPTVEGTPLAWTTAAFMLGPTGYGIFKKTIVQEPVVVIDTGKEVKVVRLSNSVEMCVGVAEIKVEWV